MCSVHWVCAMLLTVLWAAGGAGWRVLPQSLDPMVKCPEVGEVVMVQCEEEEWYEARVDRYQGLHGALLWVSFLSLNSSGIAACTTKKAGARFGIALDVCSAWPKGTAHEAGVWCKYQRLHNGSVVAMTYSNPFCGPELTSSDPAPDSNSTWVVGVVVLLVVIAGVVGGMACLYHGQVKAGKARSPVELLKGVAEKIAPPRRNKLEEGTPGEVVCGGKGDAPITATAPRAVEELGVPQLVVVPEELHSAPPEPGQTT
eukprot:Sspe_Gene.76859::Locus_48008_Transcript_1_1_Confidence_1.000_Length_854::g.76859::m.76859